MPTIPATHDITIWHNPACGTSRSTLALIRESGIEPTVVEYLKTPPDRALLTQTLSRMGIGARGLLRGKEKLVKALGLDAPDVTDEQVLEAMLEHPILINRPVVLSPRGAKLCRPAEEVVSLLRWSERPAADET